MELLTAIGILVDFCDDLLFREFTNREHFQASPPNFHPRILEKIMDTKDLSFC